MLGELLIALAVRVLLCLYGSGDHSGPYETDHYSRHDDLFDKWRATRQACLTTRHAADAGILGTGGKA